jgi:hypothetical protein
MRAATAAAAAASVVDVAASESMGVSQILCRAYGIRLWGVCPVCFRGQ